jgi:hypothetical protein
MYYSYVEIEYVAMSFSPARTDLALKLLKLNKSLYDLKQAGYNWFKKICEGLVVQDFIQSQVDKCAFFRKDYIILTY